MVFLCRKSFRYYLLHRSSNYLCSWVSINFYCVVARRDKLFDHHQRILQRFKKISNLQHNSGPENRKNSNAKFPLKKNCSWNFQNTLIFSTLGTYFSFFLMTEAVIWQHWFHLGWMTMMVECMAINTYLKSVLIFTILIK